MKTHFIILTMTSLLVSCSSFKNTRNKTVNPNYSYILTAEKISETENRAARVSKMNAKKVEWTFQTQTQLRELTNTDSSNFPMIWDWPSMSHSNNFIRTQDYSMQHYYFMNKGSVYGLKIYEPEKLSVHKVDTQLSLFGNQSEGIMR